MKLLPHVDKVKAELAAKKDHRLKMMCVLTESDSANEGYLEEMWESIFKAEKKYDGALNDEWVYFFLNAVTTSMEEKPYFSMNGEKRKKLLEDIKNQTTKLKKLYQDSGLDQPFLSYDPDFFTDFHSFDEEGKSVIETDLLPCVGITDALDFYEDFANDEIGSYVQSGKLVERHKSNRFVRVMGQRNVKRYGQPLLGVLIKSAYAIYDEVYSEPDVLNLVKGRRK
ncbi:MAG: hypothetical protein WC989_08045 [Micavibrio sp.]